MVGTLDQGGGGDGASVDHWVKRPVGTFVEYDRIERFAARFHANFLQHLFDAMIFQGEGVNERFGDRLDCKQMARIADLVNLAIGANERDAEQRRIGFGEFGNVVRNLAGEIFAVLAVNLKQRRENRRKRRLGGAGQLGLFVAHGEPRVSRLKPPRSAGCAYGSTPR